MRRLGGFILATVLMLVCVLSSAVPAYASAERDRLGAQVQVSKSSLPGPGTVDLKLTITNKGNPVKDVTITYPETGQKVTLGDLAANQTEVHENPRWEITQSMLDTPLTFEVSWTSEDGRTASGTTPAVTIAEASATVNVRAEAVVDKAHVDEGEKVTFTFTFENTGNVEITNAYLVAPPLNGGDRLGDDFSVEPGQSNTKTWSPTVNEEITVQPEYTYTVSGEEHKLACDPITVYIGEGGEEQPTGAAMSISATPNQTTVGPGGRIEFSVAVQNIGSTEISNVRVVSSNGVAAQLAQNSLMPGASTTATQNVTIDQTQSVTYTVTGTSEGEPLSVDSEPVQITVDPNMAVPSPTPMDASNIIQIDVSVVTQVSKAGPVPVEVTVRNLSTQDLKNIVVTAESGAAGATGSGTTSAAPSLLETAAAAAAPASVTIGTLANLAAGANEIINGTLDIQQTTSYVFRVEAEMADDTLVTSETSAALITLENQAAGLENWQWIAIIMGAVILAVVIILVVYVRRRRGDEEKQQSAAQGTHGGPPQSPRPPQKAPQRTAGVPATPPRQSEAADLAGQERHQSRTTQGAAPRGASQPPAQPKQQPRKVAKTRPSASSQAPTQQYGDRNNF